MGWNPLDDPCDYILLAGQKSPGVADVTGASSPREWEERKGYGMSGAWSLFMRRNLARFSVTLRLYTTEDWAAWDEWKQLVDQLPKRRTSAKFDTGFMEITHPLLADLDIRAVGVGERMQAVQTGDGEWSIEIKFIEWRPLKQTLAKPDGAQAEPSDPYDDKIQGLLDQAQRLAGDNG
jgi:hypothetical protein